MYLTREDVCCCVPHSFRRASGRGGGVGDDTYTHRHKMFVRMNFGIASSTEPVEQAMYEYDINTDGCIFSYYSRKTHDATSSRITTQPTPRGTYIARHGLRPSRRDGSAGNAAGKDLRRYHSWIYHAVGSRLSSHHIHHNILFLHVGQNTGSPCFHKGGVGR